MKSQLTTVARAALFEERRLIRRSLKAPHFLPSLALFLENRENPCKLRTAERFMQSSEKPVSSDYTVGA